MNTPNRGPVIDSTGLLWSVERLRGRYRFLRKLTEAVRFDLVYYPYWILSQRGSLKGRLFGPRLLTRFRAVDAVKGANYQISMPPERYVEPLDESVLSVDPVLTEAEALEAGKSATLKEWNRKFNRPWRPRVALEVTAVEAVLLWKPYWVMRPEHQPEEADRQRLFLFDATTGLGGVAEFWHVAEYLLGLEEGHHAVEAP